MILVVLNLVLMTVMVEVVWVLAPPNFNPRKLIVGLMVEILCHIRVGIIHPRVIETNTGPLLHYICVGSTILVLLMMVEVVLVIRKNTFTPINYI